MFTCQNLSGRESQRSVQPGSYSQWSWEVAVYHGPNLRATVSGVGKPLCTPGPSLGATVSGAGKPLCTPDPSSNPECSASLISLAAPLLTCGIFDSTPFHVCAARPLHSGSEHVLPPRGKTLCEKLSVTFMCQWYLEVAPGLLGAGHMPENEEWG